jgi:opacity protein-like surface antigen
VQNRNKLAAVLLVGLFGLRSLPAQAQADNYRVQITPYGFITGVNGTVEEQGRSASVDASFRDILDHLNMVAAVYADARFGRWRGTLDNLYTDVSNERATPGPLFSSVRVASRVWMVDPGVGYAIFQQEGKELDVVAGVRVWNVKNNLTLFRQNIQADFGRGNRSVADPVVGVHFSTDLPRNVFVFGKGDIGGFDVGAHLDWQAFGGAGYKISDRIVGTVGYRYISVNDKPSSAVYDVVLKGVIVGIGVRF